MTESEQDALAAECNPREVAFVHEYVIDGVGSQAVLRCGCYDVSTPESAASQATRLLSRAHVKALIAVVTAQRASRSKMTADSVLHEMSFLSHSRIDHYVIDDDGQVKLAAGAPEGAMAAIKSVKRKKTVKLARKDDEQDSITYEVEVTLWDKPTPLRLMGKQIGLFPEKLEHSGPNGKPIETVTEIRRTIVRAGVEDKATS